MKFNTQHIRVSDGHNTYQLHRDGNTTWETRGGGEGEQVPSNIIEHETVAAAKALFGNITSVSK